MTNFDKQVAAWRMFAADDLNAIMEDTASNVGIENYERKIETFLAVNAAGRGDIAVQHVLTFLKKIDALTRTLPSDQLSRFMFTVIPLLSVYGADPIAA